LSTHAIVNTLAQRFASLVSHRKHIQVVRVLTARKHAAMATNIEKPDLKKRSRIQGLREGADGPATVETRGDSEGEVDGAEQQAVDTFFDARLQAGQSRRDNVPQLQAGILRALPTTGLGRLLT